MGMEKILDHEAFVDNLLHKYLNGGILTKISKHLKRDRKIYLATVSEVEPIQNSFDSLYTLESLSGPFTENKTLKLRPHPFVSTSLKLRKGDIVAVEEWKRLGMNYEINGQRVLQEY